MGKIIKARMWVNRVMAKFVRDFSGDSVRHPSIKFDDPVKMELISPIREIIYFLSTVP